METAGIRIKFKPLIHKKTKNNSKCFLEIVPEVSSIQNLDKFIWKRKSNLIIYTIPMTHKVVLQKLEAVQDDSDTTVKTYHSCVDLLLTTSNSMLGCLGSGDVTKIISDTVILKKYLNKFTSEEHSFHGLPDRPKHSDYDSIQQISRGTTHTLLQLENLEKKQSTANFMDYKEQPKTNNQRILNVCSESLNKMTNTENVYPIFGDTVKKENVVMETVTKSFIKPESPRLLSLSPICSVNTYETPFINTSMSCKSVTCKIHESQRDLVLFGSISSPSDLSRDNQALSTIIDVTRQMSPRKLRVMSGNSPEMRVVEYVRYIENEILPLKMLFNEIKRKCTALGIDFSKQLPKQCMEINTVATSSSPKMLIDTVSTNNIPKMIINTVLSSSTPKMSIAAETTKSNRAVFKIVFDG